MISRYDQRVGTAMQEATAELIVSMRASLRELVGRYQGDPVWLGNTYSFRKEKHLGGHKGNYYLKGTKIVESYPTGGILGFFVQTEEREVSPDEIPFEQYENNGFIKYIAEKIEKAQSPSAH